MGLELQHLRLNYKKSRVVGRTRPNREKLVVFSALKEELQRGGYEGQSQCKSN